MSARYEISADHVHWLDVRDPHGNRNTVNQPAAVALIRQQSADIASLRAELAAVVAERDRLIAALARSCDEARNELYACQLAFDWRQRAEQAEARLAAIDAAPTVAVVCSSECFGAFVQQRFFGSELPNIGTDLIARPAKD